MGLIYDETISAKEVYQIYLWLFVSLNFKKKYTVKTKKNKPGILVSGQIAKDLKVGDKKIIKESRRR